MKKHFSIIAVILSAAVLCSACGKSDKNTVSIKEQEPVRLNVDDKYTVEVKHKKGEEVQWSSNDEKIAVINSEGTITAKGNGITTVTAKTETGYDHLGVIVGGDDVYTDENGNVVQKFDQESDITEISVAVKAGGSGDISIKTGDKFTLEAKTTPADSTDKIVWQSEDPKIVKVSETGEIEACAAGKTMVRAYAPNGVCGELIVRVR